VTTWNSVSDQIADRSDASDEWAVKLMTSPTSSVNVRRPTRVLPLSISSLLTICERYDFISGNLLEAKSTMKTMSMGQSTGTRGSTGGGGSPATTYYDHIVLLDDAALHFSKAAPQNQQF